MSELPIYPESKKAPGHALDERKRRLTDAPPGLYREALEGLRRRSARETLRLTGAAAHAEEPVRVEALMAVLVRLEDQATRMSAPSVAFIREIHRHANPDESGDFRQDDPKPQFRNARPSPARFVESRLDNLLEWLSGESGQQMFPAERMTLWFARFVEIAPFAHGNFRTAHLFLSFFAAVGGYPPVTLLLDDAEEVREEVERAIAFDTGPLVTRLTSALDDALRECEEAVEAAR